METALEMTAMTRERRREAGMGGMAETTEIGMSEMGVISEADVTTGTAMREPTEAAWPDPTVMQGMSGTDGTIANGNANVNGTVTGAVCAKLASRGATRKRGTVRGSARMMVSARLLPRAMSAQLG
jgi:hypothetical protein